MSNAEQLEINKLDISSKKTLLRDVNKLDIKDQENAFNTNICEITAEDTPETTTSSSMLEVSTSVCSVEPENLVFAHWKEVMNHPNAKMDNKRLQLIRQSLKYGYSVQEICNAISGCAVTPHNIGDNEKGQRYDGLHIILKNADQIDRFITNYFHPPKKKTKFTQALVNSLDAGQRWLGRGKNE